MKKIKLIKVTLSILFLTGIIFSGISQSIVKDIGDLKFVPKNVIPDVNGKILISEELDNTSTFENSRGSIEVYHGWPQLGSGESRRGGIYCNLDDDPDLEIVNIIGQSVYAWDIEGTPVPGWPQEMEQISTGAPSFGDVDGDGEEEIVVSTRQYPYGNDGWLYVFEKDGTPTIGFPRTLSNGGAVETPVLADLDNDNALEILISENNYPDGFLVVYRGDGSIFPGFPIQFDGLPGCAAAVGDITGDEIPEIVVESYFSLYVFDVSGNVLDGFPFTPGNDRVFSYSSPVLVDLDGDGFREIVFGDHQTAGDINGAVHILRKDGTNFTGWPKYTTHWVYGPPAVGDIDGDGSLDIAVGDQTASSAPYNKVYVWDMNGNYLPGWPTEPIMAINNQIIIADLDGDYEVELMWDDNTSDAIYLGYNHDGTVMDGWPLDTQFSSFFINPFVADVNNDGITDISGGGSDIMGNNDCAIYLWDAGANYHPELNYLPVLQYNLQHTGVYQDPTTTNINDIETEDHVNIYPNPAHNTLYVNLNLTSPEKVKIQMYNTAGVLVLKHDVSEEISTSEVEVNVSKLKKGNYYLIAKSSNLVIKAMMVQIF